MMRKQDPIYDPQDTEELLREADAVLNDSTDPSWEDQYDHLDDTMVFQNFSNRYGQDVRNYQNNYGMGGTPAAQPARPQSAPFRAYNGDITEADKKPHRNTMADAAARQAQARSRTPGVPQADAPQVPTHTAPKKRRMGCLLPILLVVALLIGAWFFLIRPPKSDQPIGSRKGDTATILLCGTDADGTRTDTMMLLYISGSERQVNLVSLPRDTYTITAAGNGAKLNSAYGRNGTGEEGMEGLLDYVQDIIGYRPDGYVLVDFNIIEEVVDLMGGVEVDVPMAMSWKDIYIGFEFSVDEGLQTLNGNDVMGVLRYRYGYYNQDLGRIEMQRKVLKACMAQWLKPTNLPKLVKALKLFQDRSLSNLSLSNYLWAGLRVMTIGTKDLATETLPGYPTMIGDQSCYVLNPDQVADMINEVANPYKVAVSEDDLNIAG